MEIKTWADFRAMSLIDQKRYVITMRRAGYTDTQIAANLGEPPHRIEYWKSANGMQLGKTCTEPRKMRGQTLCWRCRNAVGGCSWSQRFEPVNGWTAVVTQPAVYLSEAMQKIPDYCVIKCPEFERG